MKKLITILALTAAFACADDLDGRMPPVGGLAMWKTAVAPSVERTATIYVPGPAQVVRDTVVQERVVERFIVVEDGVSKWSKNDPNYGGSEANEIEASEPDPVPVSATNYQTVSDAEAKAGKWLLSAGYTWVPGESIYYKAKVIRTWDYDAQVYRRKMAVSHTFTTGAIYTTEVEVVCGVPALHSFGTGHVTPDGLVYRTSRTDDGEVVVHEGSVGYFLYEKACESAY